MSEIKTKNGGQDFEQSPEVTKVGRPPMFSSPEELQDSITNYFTQIKESNEPATITGLALHLGFESRQSFYDYEDKEEFTYTIRRARLRIEYEYEKKLSGQACTGSIFALKQFSWKDKTEVENSGSMTINWNEQKTYETK